MLHRVVCSYFSGTTSYISSSSNLTISLSNLIFGQIDPVVLSSTIDCSCLINVSDCRNVATDTLVNQPLLLKNLGENLTGGDGTLRIFTKYYTR